MKLYYSPDYIAAAASFDTTRKSGWIAQSLAANPIERVEITAPVSLTFAEIAQVHDEAYVRAVRIGQPRHLAEAQGFSWDRGMWTAVTSSNGGVAAAARAAIADGSSGSLSSGLHHAQKSTGASFCTFNGLVIAARKALDEGAKTVLIIDLDAHCGGGTHSLIEEEPRIRQLDVSVNALDGYWMNGENTLDIVRDAKNYLPTIRQRISELGDYTPDLCIYNAGMDPHERCDAGGLAGITTDMLREREEMVFAWAKERTVPVAFVLAGGYCGDRLSQEEVVNLHRLTIGAAI